MLDVVLTVVAFLLVVGTGYGLNLRFRASPHPEFRMMPDTPEMREARKVVDGWVRETGLNPKTLDLTPEGQEPFQPVRAGDVDRRRKDWREAAYELERQSGLSAKFKRQRARHGRPSLPPPRVLSEPPPPPPPPVRPDPGYCHACNEGTAHHNAHGILTSPQVLDEQMVQRLKEQFMAGARIPPFVLGEHDYVELRNGMGETIIRRHTPRRPRPGTTSTGPR